MFDFLRNRGTTAAEKRQDTLHAYLENTLTAAERERFEKQLAGDPALRDDVERLRTLKIQMRSMPRRRVPRSFALDPALYGRPKPQPLMRAYPVLRGATALTAFLLIFTLALGAFQGGLFGQPDGAQTAEVATMSEMPVEEAAMPEESAQLAAPEAGGATEREMATVVAAEESAELLATEVVTDSFTFEAAPAPLATPAPEVEAVTGVPETELSDLPMDAADATTAETEIAEVGPPANPVEDEVFESFDTAEETDGRTFGDTLGLLQLVLGVAFLVLLVLWLVARRRVRSF